jgi:hypothetical protein
MLTQSLFDKLWERLNLRGGLTFDEYTEIRNSVNSSVRQMIDDMILGNKQHEKLSVYEVLYGVLYNEKYEVQ